MKMKKILIFFLKKKNIQQTKLYDPNHMNEITKNN
jgi:hypothetical protein